MINIGKTRNGKFFCKAHPTSYYSECLDCKRVEIRELEDKINQLKKSLLKLAEILDNPPDGIGEGLRSDLKELAKKARISSL